MTTRARGIWWWWVDCRSGQFMIPPELEIAPRANVSGYSCNGYLTASFHNFTELQAVRLVQEAAGAATESVTVGIDGNNRYIIGVRAVTSITPAWLMAGLEWNVATLRCCDTDTYASVITQATTPSTLKPVVWCGNSQVMWSLE